MRRVYDDRNGARALWRFTEKGEKAGILSELCQHRHDDQPRERRRRPMTPAARQHRRPPGSV